MLISELNGWHWLITWDNPDPADSSSMLRALSDLGKVIKVQTKTTVLFAPRQRVGWRRIRRTLEQHLHPSKGNVAYANMRSRKSFEFGRNTNFRWKAVGKQKKKKK